MASDSPQRITPRNEDYSRWYQDVIRQGELAEPAEVVRGCMVIRPHGYGIWERIQADLDRRFKETGHKNASFPLLIPESFIAKEAQHVEGFAPELAIVTHAGGKELEERYVIRPTSETIIGHFFSRWVESWRDLPLLINQWCNVMRWELRTRPFLRTSEFLWQEGHTAHATHQEALEEVHRMLEVYAQHAEQNLAMPVIRGIKTASERFAGAVETLCVEALMQDGKALQVGTSHDLGQNFGRAFDVRFQTQTGQMDYVWQTSWGSSTRLVGGLIMTHSDDAGLVLPPRVAPVQVVIVPILGGKGDPQATLDAAHSLCRELCAANIRCEIDARDYKPGFKYFAWEQKGVPLRIELGPRDIAANQLTVKGRIDTTKSTWPRAHIAAHVTAWLEQMQQRLFDRALAEREQKTLRIDSWDDFVGVFEGSGSALVSAHWDGTAATEAAIKEQTRATIRCIPLHAPDEPGRCVRTGAPSLRRVLFAKAY